MPLVLFKCKRCRVNVDLSYTLFTVCVAGILDPRFELRNNIIQNMMRGSPMFEDITAPGATNRYHSWVQKARAGPQREPEGV